MKKWLLLFLLLYFLGTELFSQKLLPMHAIDHTVYLYQNLNNTKEKGILKTNLIDIPNSIHAPFISFTLSIENKISLHSFELSLVLWNTDHSESEMIPLSFDFHENSPTDNQIHTVPVYIPSNKKAFSIQFFSETAGDFRNVPLNIHLFNPGNSKNDQSNYTEKSVARNEKCEQPIYLDRNDWCPTCPEDSTPEFTIPTHLIIHHSAGSNSSSDWSAVVRSIWDYHVNVRGWDDIGYNWLIDPNGLLYEGRGNDRQGAHFCGYNGETLGCCMMGTYTNTKPSDASRETLVELMAWKADELDIDPTTSSFHNSSGLELKHVSGHRDGCSTECPGGSFYADFDDLRSDIKKYIAEECREQVIIDPVISLSPNPTRGFFTLQNPYEEKLDMEIFSMDGKLVLRDLIEANSGLFIDLPQLPNGIYIILLNGATVHWKNKFVVL